MMPKGFKHSQKTKKKMSKTRKGKLSWKKGLTMKTDNRIKSSWNKGLTAKTDKRVAKIGKPRPGKLNPFYGKHHTKECKERFGEKIRIANTGRKHSRKTKEKIGKVHKGKITSEKTRRKQRISTINYIKQNNGIRPSIGKDESEILDQLEYEYGYKILRQRPVIGYFLDGYIPKLNLVIEIDEPFHKRLKVKQRDIERQEEVEQELNCQFLRIEA